MEIKRKKEVEAQLKLEEADKKLAVIRKFILILILKSLNKNC